MAARDVLFAAGDVTYDLFVVLAGEVRIIERHGQPGETVITKYGRSQFLGEIGLLTGQRAYLSAVVSTAGRVLRVPVEQVRLSASITPPPRWRPRPAGGPGRHRGRRQLRRPGRAVPEP